MATSKYESQFLTLVKESLIINSKADKYIKNLNNYSDLTGRIAIEISQIHHMSVYEARSYIDGRTGRFKPGKALHVCPSDKIQGLFNQLELVTSEINNCPWTTKEAAINDVAVGQNKVKSMLSQIKNEVGVEAAKEILNRTMDLARRQTGVK